MGGAEPLYNEIDPNSFVFNQDKEAWVFIHGMLYSALKKMDQTLNEVKQR